ncbi:hypothetical protein GCM10009609_07570 [Pseudonocardia aurantiaca]
MATTPHIVVLGAGYTGLTAAKLIAKRTGATVTLVNNRDRFVERMRNHQLASGQRLRDIPLRDLLEGAGIRLIVDHVTRIDPVHRQIELSSGEPVGYDLLIYALGSHADLHSVPGAAEHATAVAGAEQAARLRDRMRIASTVVVVGGGLTGIEAAAELAETYPDRTVRLATSGTLGVALSERGQAHLHRTFDRLGIQLREHAQVAKVAADGVLLEDGEHVAPTWWCGPPASGRPIWRARPGWPSATTGACSWTPRCGRCRTRRSTASGTPRPPASRTGGNCAWAAGPGGWPPRAPSARSATA